MPPSRSIFTLSAVPLSSGPCLAALDPDQLPASALPLHCARRLTGSTGLCRAAAFGSAGLIVAGRFVTAPGAAALAAATIGFCCAFVLVLTLALPPQLAPPGDVDRLSAGMFAFGRMLSCLMPPLGGMIWDAT
jgi:hypothetical protein